MRRICRIATVVFFAVLFLSPPVFSADETVTITTYYPSPNGSYRDLHSNQMGVGADYQNGVLQSNSLVVQGNVGIGTNNPQTTLDINGVAVLVPRSAGDPAGVNGMIYYNTVTNKFRVYENGGWKNLFGGGFGNWVDMSVAAGGGAVQGSAATDGFVCARLTAYNVARIQGYTDSANPPTTLRVSSDDTYPYSAPNVLYSGFTMPVKKGDYWRVTTTGSGGTISITIYWIPLE